MLQSPPLDRVPGAILLVAAAICLHGASVSGSDGALLWPAGVVVAIVGIIFFTRPGTVNKNDRD